MPGDARSTVRHRAAPARQGIVNVPPIRSRTGAASSTRAACPWRLVDEGADLIDLGPRHRPGPLRSAERQWQRLEPVLAGLASTRRLPLGRHLERRGRELALEPAPASSTTSRRSPTPPCPGSSRRRERAWCSCHARHAADSSRIRSTTTGLRGRRRAGGAPRVARFAASATRRSLSDGHRVRGGTPQHNLELIAASIARRARAAVVIGASRRASSDDCSCDVGERSRRPRRRAVGRVPGSRSSTHDVAATVRAITVAAALREAAARVGITGRRVATLLINQAHSRPDPRMTPSTPSGSSTSSTSSGGGAVYRLLILVKGRAGADVRRAAPHRAHRARGTGVRPDRGALDRGHPQDGVVIAFVILFQPELRHAWPFGRTRYFRSFVRGRETACWASRAPAETLGLRRHGALIGSSATSACGTSSRPAPASTPRSRRSCSSPCSARVAAPRRGAHPARGDRRRGGLHPAAVVEPRSPARWHAHRRARLSEDPTPPSRRDEESAGISSPRDDEAAPKRGKLRSELSGSSDPPRGGVGGRRGGGRGDPVEKAAG